MAAMRALEDLAHKGFIVDEGIRLCGGDEEIYMEVLWAAMEEGREKIPLIRKIYKQGDFERYRIEMHGMKNAMRSIGASYLADLAGEQETTVKSNPDAVTAVAVEELLSQYELVVAALEELLGEAN